MPNTALQLREGTSVEHASFAGASGELTYDSDKNTVVIHDGATLGGFALARAGQLSSVTQVANITARNALSATSGDMAIVISNSTNYIYDGTNWVELQTPADTVSSVNTQTGSVVLNAGHVGALASTHAASSVTTTGISHWNSAWGWGDHASAGYAANSHDHDNDYYNNDYSETLNTNVVQVETPDSVPGVDPPRNLKLIPSAGGMERGSVEIHPDSGTWYEAGGSLILKGAKDMYASGTVMYDDVEISNESGSFKINGQTYYTAAQVNAQIAAAGQPPVSRDVEGTHANGQLFISSTNVAYWKLDGQWFEVGPLISAATASDLP